MVDALCKPARVKLQFDNLRTPRCMLAWRETSLALSGFNAGRTMGFLGNACHHRQTRSYPLSPFRTCGLVYSPARGCRARFYLLRGSFGRAAFFGHAQLAFSLV